MSPTHRATLTGNRLSLGEGFENAHMRNLELDGFFSKDPNLGRVSLGGITAAITRIHGEFEGGGVDYECQEDVDLEPGGQVDVEYVGNTIYLAQGGVAVATFRR